MAVNSAKSRWIPGTVISNFSEMIQLTIFCIYKCMCIINSKYSCTCLVCRKVIGPKPDPPDCTFFEVSAYIAEK